MIAQPTDSSQVETQTEPGRERDKRQDTAHRRQRQRRRSFRGRKAKRKEELERGEANTRKRNGKQTRRNPMGFENSQCQEIPVSRKKKKKKKATDPAANFPGCIRRGFKQSKDGERGQNTNTNTNTHTNTHTQRNTKKKTDTEPYTKKEKKETQRESARLQKQRNARTLRQDRLRTSRVDGGWYGIKAKAKEGLPKEGGARNEVEVQTEF
jgi:hypothetical protein